MVTQISALPNFGNDCCNETGHGRGIGHVESFGKDLGIVLLANAFGGGVQSVSIARAHGEAAALGSERLGGGQSDSLTGCCYERDTAFESEIHRGEFGIINGRKPSTTEGTENHRGQTTSVLLAEGERAP